MTSPDDIEELLSIDEEVLMAGAEQLLRSVADDEDIGVTVARIYFAMELTRKEIERWEGSPPIDKKHLN